MTCYLLNTFRDPVVPNILCKRAEIKLMPHVLPLSAWPQRKSLFVNAYNEVAWTKCVVLHTTQTIHTAINRKNRYHSVGLLNIHKTKTSSSSNLPYLKYFILMKKWKSSSIKNLLMHFIIFLNTKIWKWKSCAKGSFHNSSTFTCLMLYYGYDKIKPRKTMPHHSPGILTAAWCDC